MSAPLYSRPAEERDGTKGRRKDARRNVRNALGTSSEPAPSLHEALLAAESLRRIIDLASGGRYGLAVVRPTFEGEQCQHRLAEQWTHPYGPSPRTTVEYTGTGGEISSQIHEPVTETLRRERHLRELERGR